MDEHSTKIIKDKICDITSYIKSIIGPFIFSFVFKKYGDCEHLSDESLRDIMVKDCNMSMLSLKNFPVPFDELKKTLNIIRTELFPHREHFEHFSTIEYKFLLWRVEKCAGIKSNIMDIDLPCEGIELLNIHFSAWYDSFKLLINTPFNELNQKNQLFMLRFTLCNLNKITHINYIGSDKISEYKKISFSFTILNKIFDKTDMSDDVLLYTVKIYCHEESCEYVANNLHEILEFSFKKYSLLKEKKIHHLIRKLEKTVYDYYKHDTIIFPLYYKCIELIDKKN
jgi:hypothetical protein